MTRPVLCLVFAIVGSLALDASSFVVHAQEAKKEDAKPEKKKPETHTVKAERLKIELKLSGTFESEQAVEVSLRPKVWSKMEVRQAVSHGTAVKKSSALIEFDLQDLERAIKAAEQGVELGRLGLEESKVALDALRKTTPIDLEAAKRNSKNAQDDLDYFLKVTLGRSKKSAQESLKRSQYSLEYAQEELNQLRQMYKADDLTEETEEIILKRAERSVASSKFFLESAELRTQRTLATDLPRQEQTLRDSTVRELSNVAKAVTALSAGMRKAEIGLEKQIIEARKADENLAELKADHKLLSSVKSPIDGYVYFGRVKDGKWAGKGTFEAALKPGGAVTPKQVFMTVVSANVNRIRTSVSEKDLRNVMQGMSGKATATVDPDTKLAVKVESVSRVPSAPGSFDCVISLAASPKAIVAGMSGEVVLVTYDKKDALLVPKSAVFENDGDDSRYVYVIDGDSHAKRVVKTGRSKGVNVEVKDGLAAGDQILLKKPEGE